MTGARACLMLMVFLAALPGWAGQQKQKPADPAQSEQRENGATDHASAEKDIEVGTFYMHKGDTDAAIPRFQDAIHKQPKLGKPRILLAEAYEKKGDNLSAAKCYQEYLRAFPNAPDKKKIEKKIEKLSNR
ncbi:MAG TPA: tetratricopeptide repeat protein [Candidatus Acidoferrales bacterium]|nr:tetratricopeptide repeat protein [Candidatus Acidoferrales bacterium]